MAYIINNSRGDTIATVQSGTENTTATSITLIGANFPQYGEPQNENFVFMLENFANSTAPVNPILGQLWYNSTTDVLSQYTSTNQWLALATQNYVQAQKISPVFTGIPQAPTAANATSSNQLATTLFVNNTINYLDLAPRVSPNLAGVPTTPTAANNTATGQIASTEFVRNFVNDPTLTLYATKASPALTGIPTAPTAANATFTTQIATTEFVRNTVNDTDLSPYATKVNAVLTGVPTAPTAANTTANSQIATTQFVSDLINSVDLTPYAPKASPILTGIPTTPTASASTNTTQIASTAFVQQQKISPQFTGSPLAPTAPLGTANTQIATTQFVAAALGAGAPGQVDELAGSIKMWGGATAPANWALCDGSAVSRTTYATLFARIGTTFGTGDGSTTFNLPDFRNRFPIGPGGATLPGNTGGSADSVVVQHTHLATVTDPGHFHDFFNDVGSAQPSGITQPYVLLERASLTEPTSTKTTGITVTNSTTGVSGVGANLPPWLACYWIIKVSDDGAGGGTLQAGVGIDITTAGAYSTITNVGVTRLIAGTGVTLSSQTGNIVIDSAGGGTADIAGSIKLWGGDTAPTDWVFCDGAALSRTTYPSLFSRIGTAYGTGDGSTTFNIPDFRGRFGIGSNATYPRGGSDTVLAKSFPLMDFTNPDTYELSTAADYRSSPWEPIRTEVTVNPYYLYGGPSFPTVPQVLSAPPNGDQLVCVFGYGKADPSSSNSRFCISNSVDVSGVTQLTYYVNMGTEAGWGQVPDGETLVLEYCLYYSAGSPQGVSQWVTLDTVPTNVTPNTWLLRTVNLPAAITSNPTHVTFRFRQNVNHNDSPKPCTDTWAFTRLVAVGQAADWPVNTKINGADYLTTQDRIGYLSTPYIIKINDNGTQRSGTGGGDTSRAGDIKWVAYGSGNFPPGWRLADGSEVVRAEYPALFARISTTYGAGNGSTTFNLPDMRGRFAISETAGATGATRASVTRGNVGGSPNAVVVSHRHQLKDPVSGAKFYGINDYLNNSNAPAGWQRDPPAASPTIDSPNQARPDEPWVGQGPSGEGDASLYNWTDYSGESGTGKNMPPYLTIVAIIKMDDDTVNTGGILQAGPGISITTSGIYATISSTVTQNPVVAGAGITVQNSPGGALVSANVVNVVAGTGVTVTKNAQNVVTVSNNFLSGPIAQGYVTWPLNQPTNPSLVGAQGVSSVAFVEASEGYATYNLVFSPGLVSNTNYVVMLTDYNTGVNSTYLLPRVAATTTSFFRIAVVNDGLGPGRRVYFVVFGSP